MCPCVIALSHEVNIKITLSNYRSHLTKAAPRFFQAQHQNVKKKKMPYAFKLNGN